MNDQLHPDLSRLQQQYMQLFQAVTDQTMSVDQALSTLGALKAIDGAGYEWSYTPDGQLVRAVPGQPGQPAQPWEFTPPQLPPHASDPGLYAPGPGPFGAPGTSPFGGPPTGFPGQAAPAPQAPSGRYAGAPARSLPSNVAGGDARQPNPIVARLLGILRTQGKLMAVIAVCAVLLLVALGQLRGDERGPTVADGVPVTPPAPVEVPIIPAPQPTMPGQGGSGDGPAGEGAAGTPASTAPDGDRVLAVFSALRSADVALLETTVVQTGTPLATRLLAAQLAGFAAVGLELVADPAAASGDGQATQTWRVIDLDTGETLNTLTIDWVLRDGQWLISSVPPLG
jgi:hypothetical protein